MRYIGRLVTLKGNIAGNVEITLKLISIIIHITDFIHYHIQLRLGLELGTVLILSVIELGIGLRIINAGQARLARLVI